MIHEMLFYRSKNFSRKTNLTFHLKRWFLRPSWSGSKRVRNLDPNICQDFWQKSGFHFSRRNSCRTVSPQKNLSDRHINAGKGSSISDVMKFFIFLYLQLKRSSIKGLMYAITNTLFTSHKWLLYTIIIVNSAFIMNGTFEVFPPFGNNKILNYSK